jgi:hypothetical protein
MSESDQGDAGGTKGDGKEESKAGPLSLDEAHNQILNQRGDELSLPEKEEDDDEDEGNDPDPADDPDSEHDADQDAGGEADPADDEEDADDGNLGDAGDTTGNQDLEAPDLNADIDKPGKYKAEFVDLDGKKYYVSDVSQLPDDFDPASQKQSLMAMQDLSHKQIAAQKDQADYQQQVAEQARNQAANDLRNSWTKDIDQLTKSNVLPKDEKQRETVVKGVYTLMSDEMKKGNVIDSWATAHELWEARQAKGKAADDEKKDVEITHKNGAKILGSNGGGAKPGRRGGRVFQAPPSGVGLDAVHQKVISEL